MLTETINTVSLRPLQTTEIRVGFLIVPGQWRPMPNINHKQLFPSQDVFLSFKAWIRDDFGHWRNLFICLSLQSVVSWPVMMINCKIVVFWGHFKWCVDNDVSLFCQIPTNFNSKIAVELEDILNMKNKTEQPILINNNHTKPNHKWNRLSLQTKFPLEVGLV